MRTGILLSTAYALLGFSTFTQAANLTVTAPNIADTDCSADLICDLQTALDYAASNGQGDTLTIPAGEYDASAVGAFKYLSPNTENYPLHLTGAGIGNTVLDGKNSNIVLYAWLQASGRDDSNAHVTIEGITFKNGNSSGTDQPGAGLVVLTRNANIAIDACSFENNTTVGSAEESGGGLLAKAEFDGSITVTDSFFSNNSSATAGGGSVTDAVRDGNLLLRGNVYIGNNAADYGGGAVTNAGRGGMAIDRNLFLDNTSETGGAGLYVQKGSGTALLTNNVAAFNVSSGADDSRGHPGGGAGIKAWIRFASLVLSHNTIALNQDQGAGGGLLAVLPFSSSTLTVSNSIIWGNSAAGGGLCGSFACDDIAVADHYGDSMDGFGPVVHLSYNDYSELFFSCQTPDCTLTPQKTIEFNLINVDPSFVDPQQDDFRLQDVSQLIDQGNPDDPNLPAEDLDGNSRPSVAGTEPDIGAFENQQGSLSEQENCTNGKDDNANGDVDCDDFDCKLSDACFEGIPILNEWCNNGTDDDYNGQIDCEDVKCMLTTPCLDEDGLDFPIPGLDGCNDLTDCLNPSCLETDLCQDALPSLPEIELPMACTMTSGGGSPVTMVFFLLVPALLRWTRRLRG